MKRIALIAFIFLAFCACDSSKKVVEKANVLQDLIKSEWILEALNGVSVSPDDFMKGLPSLRFDQKGNMSGSTGCNQFNGDFELDGNNVNLNPGAMTKMNCPGDGEGKFLDALKGVSELNFEGDKLILADQAKELLRFAPKTKNE